jgi:hypothetical protein
MAWVKLLSISASPQLYFINIRNKQLTCQKKRMIHCYWKQDETQFQIWGIKMSFSTYTNITFTKLISFSNCIHSSTLKYSVLHRIALCVSYIQYLNLFLNNHRIISFPRFSYSIDKQLNTFYPLYNTFLAELCSPIFYSSHFLFISASSLLWDYFCFYVCHPRIQGTPSHQI